MFEWKEWRTFHGSLAVEGNTLNESQITAILEGRRVIAPPRYGIVRMEKVRRNIRPVVEATDFTVQFGLYTSSLPIWRDQATRLDIKSKT